MHSQFFDGHLFASILCFVGVLSILMPYLLQQMSHRLEEIKSVTRLFKFLPTYGSSIAIDRASVIKDGPSIATDKIKYKGDNDDALEDKNKKMDEIWINYCGMPVCFGMKESAIVIHKHLSYLVNHIL
ncbi:hypothetical protein H5410_042074 [Solanum commersonii]|uniref:Uncharacterized protein n=1 Tax=Solanum commersonii TaxID=4109 RepID=A0A9J5XWH2_SOLCO|nr:hypothetical protein H5410_042074 [Solanum commersonii]